MPSSIRKTLYLPGLGAAALALIAFHATADAQVTEYSNGRWWDGTRFRTGSFFVAGDRLSFRAPPSTTHRIDLAGGYVIPPLIEGHNHWVEPARVRAYNACYLADGVFYVRDMANMPLLADRIRPQVNRPDTVDWVSAMTGFTGPGGHPVEVIDEFIAFGILPATWRPDYDGDGVFIVTDQAGIERGLDRLQQQGASFVKAFLLFSDHYRQNLANPETRGNTRGLDPALLPGLVRSAHRRGLRVAVHVYSAADFRAAVAAGVDEIAHLPGAGYRLSMPASDFLLTAADARAAARANVAVTTTTAWLANLQENDSAMYRNARAITVANLGRLRDAGVRLLIGSDLFRRTVRSELAVLEGLGLFSGSDLLAMNTATIQAAFPGARLGALREGYRADFLVSRSDPRVRLGSATDIVLRVKSGRALPASAVAPPRSSPDCVEGPP